VVLAIPPHSRFFVVELLDAWTTNFLNLGTRNVSAEGARYALLGPDADASLAPAGTLAVRCPTALVWLLGRVIVDGPAVGAPFPSLARWRDGGDAAGDFLANLGRALADFPPPPELRTPFELLAGADIALPADGDLSRLRGAAAAGLRAAHAEAMALIEGHTHTASRTAFRFSTRLGRFGGDIMLRAATAWKGIGALAADEAIYAPADYDQHGEPLHGRHRYRIRCADGGALPADAFWSITVYGEDRFLAPHATGRHALGTRSGMVRDADGALTMHLGHAAPDAPASNWLPVPDAPFYLILRLYHPRPQLLDGRYRLPQVERLD